MITEGGIERVMRAGGPLDAMAAALLRAALDGGGHDNITVVLVRDAGEGPAPAGTVDGEGATWPR